MVVDDGIGQCERAKTVGVARRENLAHRTAAVVPDLIGLIYVECVEKRDNHARLGRIGNILIERRPGVSCTHQVERDAAAYVRAALDDVSPLMSV
jgi:hypothetical protein